jgi:hypothetical protein
MMLLIVGYCCYFVILKEVCGVGLRLQAVIHNPVLGAQVGEVTSFFSSPSKLMFLLILMLGSYCGQSVTLYPLISLSRDPTLKKKSQR